MSRGSEAGRKEGSGSHSLVMEPQSSPPKGALQVQGGQSEVASQEQERDRAWGQSLPAELPAHAPCLFLSRRQHGCPEVLSGFGDGTCC